MTETRKVVISSQRSGLNWYRFCIEHYLGVRTPGRPLIHSKDVKPNEAFVRSHDPASTIAGWTSQKPDMWRVAPSETASYTLALLVRDPLESFVRMADRNYAKFDNYLGNVRYFMSAAAARKAAFYYEDLVAKPQTMLEAMSFLDIVPAPGHGLPSLEQLTRDWDELGRASRALYDRNQMSGGGAMTKSDPLDFDFHKKRLWPWQPRLVWAHLRRHLTAEELRLLDRYEPGRDRRRR